MSIDRLQLLFDRAHNAARRRNLLPGVLGKATPSGGAVVLATERGAGFVHVRLGADGTQGNAYAYNVAVPPQKGYPVLLQREDKLLIVAGPDYARLPAFLAGQGNAGYVVPPHHHREGSGLEYEHQSKLIDRGRVKWSSGLTVSINEFRYRKSDGSWETYPGGTLDLTSYVPATAGTHAWVVVGVDPADNTAKAAAGAEVATSTDLDTADIDGVLDDGYIPLAAIDVANGDTSLSTPGDYYDARGWLNSALGSSGGTATPFVVLRPSQNEPPASAYATLDSRNGHPVLDFSDTTDESAVFTAVLPPGYGGGGLTVTLHTAYTSATSGSAVWSVAFERIGDEQQDLDADGFAAAQSVTVAVPATSGLVSADTLAFADGAEMDSVAAGELFRLKVTRDADHASDTATGDGELVCVSLAETGA